MEAPALVPGLVFSSKWINYGKNKCTILTITGNKMSVQIEADNAMVREEDDWNVAHVAIGFENGDYKVISSPSCGDVPVREYPEVEGISIHGDNCLGCLRHEKDIMITFQLPERRYLDIFLTKPQVKSMIEDLKRIYHD